jgi:hypothetical protein
MQIITFTRNATTTAACAKALARDGAQSSGSLLSGENIDEGLWAAYRCNDKTAVTQELLLRRYLAQPRSHWRRIQGVSHG